MGKKLYAVIFVLASLVSGGIAVIDAVHRKDTFLAACFVISLISAVVGVYLLQEPISTSPNVVKKS
jgi:hypothetical protein